MQNLQPEFDHNSNLAKIYQKINSLRNFSSTWRPWVAGVDECPWRSPVERQRVGKSHRRQSHRWQYKHSRKWPEGLRVDRSKTSFHPLSNTKFVEFRVKKNLNDQFWFKIDHSNFSSLEFFEGNFCENQEFRYDFDGFVNLFFKKRTLKTLSQNLKSQIGHSEP